MKLTFVVAGNPIPKARPRVIYSGSRAWAFTPKETKVWESIIAWKAREAMAEAGQLVPFTGRLKLSLVFVREGRRRCDLDNLVKAAEDAMNLIVWLDDEQIDRLIVERYYGHDIGHGRMSVKIEEIE
jgi:Holliday junction resolvase RusA-like endonuclease